MEMMIMMEMMKIVQDVKAREEETRTPEWIRHPAIQVVVIPRRRIVSDNRRAFLIVIVVNFLRLGVFATCWGLTLCILTGPRCNC